MIRTLLLLARTTALLGLFIGMYGSGTVYGQLYDPEHENVGHFVLLGGYSPQSVILLGKTPDSQTNFIYLGYRRQMKFRIFGLDTYYSAGLYPSLEFNYSKRDDNGNPDIAKGFGFSPVGLFLSHPLSKRISLGLSSNGGIIYMNKYFPTDKAQRLNYTFDLNTELIWTIKPYIALSLGYKFHHISNAQTGTENPGLDSNIFFISIIL